MTESLDKTKGTIPEGYQLTSIGLIPSDWNLRPLGTIVNEITQTAGDEIYETVSISAGIGFVNQAKKFGKELSGNQYEKYIVLHRGDFSYNKGNSQKYPQGCIYRLTDRETAAVPNVFESFQIKDRDADYFEQLFISGFLNRQLFAKINHGVRDNGLLNLTGKDFYSCKVPFPPVKEQKKIAEILIQFDGTIELCKSKLEKLKKLKKACLSKMFPKPGEVFSEIRFPGFEDPWEQRKLGEIAEFNPKSILPDSFEYVDLESVVGTEIIAHRREKRETAPSRAQRLAKQGDVFYQTVRPYQKNNCIFDKPDDNWVFSTGYAQLRPVNDGYFLLALLQNGCFVKIVLDRCTGTSYPAINSNDLAEIEVNVPERPEEHKQIGDCFRNLDRLITLHQRELEEMVKMKKALMQQLLTGKVRVKI